MKLNKRNFYLYIGIVVLPFVIFCLFYFYKMIHADNSERKQQAIWVASIYQKNWDQFISETMTTLNILSIPAETNLDTPAKIQPLLNRIHEKDPRYGGLFLLDAEGKVLLSSESLRLHKDASRLDYIVEVMKTKDTIISDHQEILYNSQRVFGLAYPVLDENYNLKAILVAYLRMDYMKNIMKVLTPESELAVVNGSDHPILEMNVSASRFTDTNWVTKPLDRLPWNIKVKISERDWNKIFIAAAKALFIFLIITHIVFLAIEYFLLKRQTVKAKKENELQKLELVGTLAASTAHEIRNPLTGVQGLMQLLSEKYTDKEDQYYFEVIDLELKRINEIVSEFLILGKPTAQLTKVINISETLQELKPLINSEGNLFNVDCRWHLPPEPVLVRCTKDQIKQVVLNITKNAFESIEGVGKIDIKLQSMENRCEIEVIDNGKGISKEALEKVFHPFYTSKETGTGLGLVVCKRIIQSFGGNIDISSTKDVGTSVKITLPITKEQK